MSDLICVGTVLGSFGVRGDVRLKSYCADAAAIEDYAPLVAEDGTGQYTVHLTGNVKAGFSARLSGVDTKEQADAAKGLRLFAPRDRLPALTDDEYYQADLIGVDVFDTGGVLLGTVKSVQNHGAGDILEVNLPRRTETVLLPFTLDAVPTVDLNTKRIIADPPEGLF